VQFLVEISGVKAPHFSNTFPVICNATSEVTKIKISQNRTESKTNCIKLKHSPSLKFFLFSSRFFANAHQHICKKPTLSQQLILQKS